MGQATYLIALGSNRLGRFGPPRRALAAALDRLPGRVIAAARAIETSPIGPSRRRFVNSAALVESALSPLAMLDRLKAIEAMFGRRAGRRWGPRSLDLDIILWSGGRWRTRRLTVPHAAFRTRRFVLTPAAAIAPTWRDPVGGRTLRQLHHRANRPRPVDHAPRQS